MGGKLLNRIQQLIHTNFTNNSILLLLYSDFSFKKLVFIQHVFNKIHVHVNVSVCDKE